MAEINQFLSPEAEKQVQEYLAFLKDANKHYSALAKALDKLNNKTH